MKERASIVVEEYLQLIYSLIANGKRVKAVNLVKRLKSSPSTVHATLSRLQRDDLITIGEKKEIEFTPAGFDKAEQLTRRHRLVEDFLCNTLGISWHEVHKHAHVLEHGLTEMVEEKLAEFLDFPKSCPHGTPLPGEDSHLPEDMCCLHDMEMGDVVEIVIIDELLEESVDLMKFLQDKNCTPGQQHTVMEKTDITKTVILESENSRATLPFDIADKIGVIKISST
ncbi:MAG: metal-dependent transcriptional regulator [Deltaproteobacteria bacterium]|nr:metal-dependent transcriptional regulator [Deltaproteobacteria bacterium]MBT4088307.1 metal-dependent transcriptional regulator [Deltaproteobacteria bacterium]MBT4264555.1 metal-dependent transcriptional regulator [Deltaproteobacteria bacterium]MBT4641378.1 metal-dependent transcriptional regulator [Deltaproteobacteria bacterium]MBT6499582.1 metal-dependent transcriptional regulator [Deltaproteobacteria bacterium]